MKKTRSSIDGFIPRQSIRSNLSVDLNNDHKKRVINDTHSIKSLSISDDKKYSTINNQNNKTGIVRSDIDESLREIDTQQEPEKKLSRRQRKRIEKMKKKHTHKVRRVVKWTSIIILIFVIAVGGFLLYKFIIAGGNIFQGDLFGFFQNQPLKQDSNGRSNFLILGTSEDDPGHGGANLTDSMLVVSLDQNDKNIYMFSVPRDLYVNYNMACISGYSGKINAYFSCVDEGTTTKAEQNRLSMTQKLVGNIFGLDIQYGVHVNHTVIKETVDAVGGIDVDIQGSEGAPGILDRNFDWRCNYTCYLVKYTNGVHHLDGEHALFLSMARGDMSPTYGLGNSNFDREKNQQKILIALKNKAISTGTLTNVNTITKLIDSFDDNLRTNIKTNEIQTLMRVVGEVKSGDVHTLTLFGKNKSSLVKTGSYGGASVVMPVAGIYEYNEIKAYIKKSLSKDPVIREAAPIAVYNGTNQAGLGQTKADILTKSGFNVISVDNVPDGIYGKVDIYQIGSGNSKTAEKLSKIYKEKVIKDELPFKVDKEIKFVVIFGQV